MKTGVELIAEERARQISEEGFTLADDDFHKCAQLAKAGFLYAEFAVRQSQWPSVFVGDTVQMPPANWPWDHTWWKPSDNPVRNLVKAGALIAAEIDRLNRLREPKK